MANIALSLGVGRLRSHGARGAMSPSPKRRSCPWISSMTGESSSIAMSVAEERLGWCMFPRPERDA